jgi:protein arginine N-methyltransferase 3
MTHPRVDDSGSNSMDNHRPDDDGPEDDSGSDSTDNPRPDDDDWEESESDDDLGIVSLFDSSVFPDVKSMVAYCKEKYAFDFVDVQKRLGG